MIQASEQFGTSFCEYAVFDCVARKSGRGCSTAEIKTRFGETSHVDWKHRFYGSGSPRFFAFQFKGIFFPANNSPRAHIRQIHRCYASPPNALRSRGGFVAGLRFSVMMTSRTRNRSGVGHVALTLRTYCGVLSQNVNLPVSIIVHEANGGQKVAIGSPTRYVANERLWNRDRIEVGTPRRSSFRLSFRKRIFGNKRRIVCRRVCKSNQTKTATIPHERRQMRIKLLLRASPDAGRQRRLGETKPCGKIARVGFPQQPFRSRFRKFPIRLHCLSMQYCRLLFQPQVQRFDTRTHNSLAF